MVTMTHTNFRFGLETEYIVTERSTGRALWYQDLQFEILNEILESISLDGIPSLEGLDLEKPHTKMMPYVVEGYHLPDQDYQARDLLPKGLEIRTPVCASIQECLHVQHRLLTRLDAALQAKNFGLLALSHHPNAHHFRGPQNKRRHDFWKWAMEVMTTYGPDINVGLPEEIWTQLDPEDLMAKINYYAPAMTALSVRAPFRDGVFWNIRGKIGQSLRVYRRSVVAPPIEFHPEENRRLEFKIFDMTSSLDEMEGYFLLFLTLLLDPNLNGRASEATRIYDSGHVAVDGFHAEGILVRLEKIFKSAECTLPRWGFSTQGLKTAYKRFDTRLTPADDLISRYQQLNEPLTDFFKKLAEETVSVSSTI